MIILGVDANTLDRSGKTALTYAVKADDEDFVQFLLEQPTIEVKEENLHLIAEYGSYHVIEPILIRYVLDINATNRRKNSH